MNTLVLGGSRFIGPHLIKKLLAAGHSVAALNRGVTPVDFPPEVERLYADRGHVDAMKGAVAGRRFDAVFDLSGYTPADLGNAFAALEGKADRYVFTSSTAVYRRADLLPIHEHFEHESSPRAARYALDKSACERLLFQAHEQGRFQATVIRPSMVYGPANTLLQREASFWTRMLRGRAIPLPGDGLTTGHFGHVEDLADAYVATLDHPAASGEAYTIVGHDAVTLLGYVRILGEIAGVQPNIVRFEPAQEELSLGGRLFPYEWRVSSIYTIEKAQRDLDYRPRFDFVGGHQQTYEWFLQSGLLESEWDFSQDDAILRRLGHPV